MAQPVVCRRDRYRRRSNRTYEQRWAVTLIERVLAALRRGYSAADKAHLNLTEGTMKVAVYRLRQRFRELRVRKSRTHGRPAGRR